MTRDHVKIIGDCYRDAAQKSLDIQEFVKTFANNLRTSGVKELQLYAAQMETSYESRKNTLIAKKLVDNMLTLATHIIYYRIKTDPEFKNTSVKCFGRLKAFESEAKKSLEHILNEDSPELKDRFGCRINILNKGLDAIRILDIITNDLIEFFCGYTTPEHIQQFLDWIDSNPEIDDETKEILHETISHNFILNKSEIMRGVGDFDSQKHPTVIVPSETLILPEYHYGVKNYILTPKDNGYQSVHFVLRMPSYSKIYPGGYFEFQIRTNQMHVYAEHQLASHTMYKAEQQKRYDEFGVAEAFQLNPDEISLLGFTLFDDGTCVDEIGLRKPVLFEVRQVSNLGIF